MSRKRNRSGPFEAVEKTLSRWFENTREGGAAISANMVMEKAKQFAIQLNVDFTPSAGWLYRWQMREGIKLRKICGESASADSESAVVFKVKYFQLLYQVIRHPIFLMQTSLDYFLVALISENSVTRFLRL